MNGGLRGYQPPTNCVKNGDQMEKVNSYRNGIPKDLPNRTKGNQSGKDVDEKQAEESLSLYCKPVELYNIIQERSKQEPLFLQRCLSYKITAALRRRIKMTVSITGYAIGRPTGKESVNGIFTRSVFLMVTRPVTFPNPTEDQLVYRLRPVQILKVGGSHRSSAAGVSFILPELRKLVQDAKNGDVVLFLIGESDVGRGSQAATFDSSTGPIVWGKLAVSSLCLNWLRNSKDNGHQSSLDGTGVESTSNVDLRHGNLQVEDSNGVKNIRISTMHKTSTERSLVQLQVRIIGTEVGQTQLNGRPTNGIVPKSVLPYSLSHAWRPRIGRVVFHYLYYYGIMRKTEVTENFSCPFCLNRCASFTGLRGHLNASHDLFNFEFLGSGELGELHVVNVTCRPEVVGPQGNIRDVDGLADPRVKNFSYWFPQSRLRLRRLGIGVRQHLQCGQSSHTLLLQGASDLAEKPHLQGGPVLQQTGDQNNQNLNAALAIVDLVHPSENRLGDSSSSKVPVPNGLIKGSKHEDNIALQHEHRKSLDTDGLGLVGKQRSAQSQNRQRMKGVLAERVHDRSRPGPTFGGACASAGGQDLDDCGQQQGISIPSKAAVDRPDIPRIHTLLQKRQYFHSHTAQPMDAEQLFGDRDSEDEVDPVVADLEDRRMLDDFVDVTPEEKEIMHLWNSFVRRNRVLADVHCLWACGQFSRENAQRFGQNPALRRCLMLFLVKLWNHHLVDGPTISKCLSIVDSHASQQQEP